LTTLHLSDIGIRSPWTPFKLDHAGNRIRHTETTPPVWRLKSRFSQF